MIVQYKVYAIVQWGVCTIIQCGMLVMSEDVLVTVLEGMSCTMYSYFAYVPLEKLDMVAYWTAVGLTLWFDVHVH